jgi:hypothetical protein
MFLGHHRPLNCPEYCTEKHGGKLDCFSTIGNGSELVIQIPIALIGAVKAEVKEMAIA